MNLVFAHPMVLHLAWAALAFVLLLAWLELHNRGVLARYVLPTMQRRLARQLSTSARVVRLVSIFLALLLGVLALARPQTRSTQTVMTRAGSADVMVVLDVSRSMLATDAAPTRLDRARAELRDMLPSLEGMRLGLVAFAGRARVLTPLTPDHGFFELSLDNASPYSIGRGGTRIGDAIRVALEAFEDDDVTGDDKGGRAILLVTDGEDHESYPLDAARAAAEAGVSIIAIGFGDEGGSTIEYVDPQSGARETVMHDGQPVVSRLDGDTLREIALATDGAYVPAGTSVLDLESIVETHIAPLVTEHDRTIAKESRVELYPWFLLGALLFFVTSSLVGVMGLRAPAPRTRREEVTA